MIISDSFKLGLLIFTLTLSPVWAQNFTQIVLPGDNGWTEGGNWIDYDDDGDLDLFLPYKMLPLPLQTKRSTSLS